MLKKQKISENERSVCWSSLIKATFSFTTVGLKCNCSFQMTLMYLLLSYLALQLYYPSRSGIF